MERFIQTSLVSPVALAFFVKAHETIHGTVVGSWD